MSYTYEYERPSVTVDIVMFGIQNEKLRVLLIERGVAPFKGSWALPGGFVQMSETLEEAAMRELSEETGVKNVFLEQLYTFGDLKRDPRGRVISVSYYALVQPKAFKIKAATDASSVNWFDVDGLPILAFDHKLILKMALKRLQGKILYAPVGFELLAEEFTLTELQKVYEAILDRELDKRNFRKKILELKLVTSTKKKQTNVSHRAAELYKFNKSVYDKLAKEGFSDILR